MNVPGKIADWVFKRQLRRFISRNIQYFPTVVASHENRIAHNQFLMEFASAAITDASRNSLAHLAAKRSRLLDSVYYDLFPGEHYRLLRSLVKALGAKNIVEIGTSTGMGSVSLIEGMGDQGHVTTFDVVPWEQLDTHLSKDLFDRNRITQILADLSDPDEFGKHRELISQSDLIFCDAPKDGVFEYKFLELLTTIAPQSKCLLVLDDIRFLNMTNLWWSIESPKLDVTSFGHASGTGWVDLSGGLKLRRS